MEHIAVWATKEMANKDIAIKLQDSFAHPNIGKMLDKVTCPTKVEPALQLLTGE